MSVRLKYLPADTSYLAADVFFRCDDLVHAGSQAGVQRAPLGLAGLHQSLVLTGGLGQHLFVHGIRDLEEAEGVKEHKRSELMDFCVFLQHFYETEKNSPTSSSSASAASSPLGEVQSHLSARGRGSPSPD